VPARVIVDGSERGSASLVQIGNDCLAITALHVLGEDPASSADAATIRLKSGQTARASVRRRIRSIDIAIMGLDNQPGSAAFCAGPFSVGDVDAALRSGSGTVEVAASAGTSLFIAVQRNGAEDRNEINVHTLAGTLDSGVSGSPLLFGGRPVGVVTRATPDGRNAVAQRIDAIADAARDIFDPEHVRPPTSGQPSLFRLKLGMSKASARATFPSSTINSIDGSNWVTTPYNFSGFQGTLLGRLDETSQNITKVKFTYENSDVGNTYTTKTATVENHQEHKTVYSRYGNCRDFGRNFIDFMDRTYGILLQGSNPSDGSYSAANVADACNELDTPDTCQSGNTGEIRHFSGTVGSQHISAEISNSYLVLHSHPDNDDYDAWKWYRQAHCAIIVEIE
jgi:hypothetical protein